MEAAHSLSNPKIRYVFRFEDNLKINFVRSMFRAKIFEKAQNYHLFSTSLVMDPHETQADMLSL